LCVYDYKALPWSAGGAGGSCHDTMGRKWPLMDFHPGMRLYSIFQMGYHINSKNYPKVE